MTRQILIGLGERSYPLFTGNGLLRNAADLIAPFVRSRNAFVITDETVAGLWLAPLEQSLREAGITFRVLRVAAGEASKSFATAGELLERMLESGCDRKTFLIALGGGVVGDLAGFCASILLRGVDFIQMPTTLLAQVDSSVGGKTAVDSRAGKNLIGSFYQPKAVIIDLDTLKTLPPRQVGAGYAEIAKYGLILRPDFWEWLEENGRKVLALDDEACRYAVEQSCKIKAEIVAEDEREETGRRALLNLGHTFGHALEAQSGMDGSILHGEAVASGCVLAARYAAATGVCDASVPERVEAHFRKTSGLVSYDGEPDDLIKWMFKDKKTLNGRLNLVLPEKIGKAAVYENADLETVKRVWKEGKS